jgi:hypothetical protein
MLRLHAPLALTSALALSACGHGGKSFSPFSPFPVPFQASSTAVAYNAASASATFTAAGGITGTGAPEPADTGGNTVTVTTGANNTLVSIVVNTATVNGTAPTTAALTITTGTVGLADAVDLANLLANVAAGGAPQMAFEAASASLSYSAYGIWAQSTGGGGMHVGTYALGNETTPAQMAALNGNAAYTGNALGFGSNGTAPFAFTSNATINVDFTHGSVTSLTFSNFDTRLLAGGAGPVIGNLTTSGATPFTAANKYSVAISGGGLNGTAVGTFYGPAANETAGAFEAAGGAITLIGAFGAHH